MVLALAVAACAKEESLLAIPAVTIEVPTTQGRYETFLSEIEIGGRVSPVHSLRWVNIGNTSSGFATIAGAEWTATLTDLAPGNNPVTLYADADGRGRTIGTASILIDYDPSAETEPPTIRITAPTDEPTYATPSDSVRVAGIAADNSGNFDVKWKNVSTGAVGIASGTFDWEMVVELANGENVIVATARDYGGNEASDTLTVAREPVPRPRH